MVVYEGVVQEIEPIKELKKGTNSGRAWILYGTHIIVDKELYGVTSFVKKDLEKLLGSIQVNDKVRFEYDIKDNYKNINKDKAIEVLASNVLVESKGVVDSKPSQEYWDLKDRRITRQSCLTRAIEFLKANKEVTGEKTAFSLEEVSAVATWFEDNHVYKEELDAKRNVVVNKEVVV